MIVLSRKRISIVIPTLNEEIALPGTLEAIARQRAPVEVIVVDGGSRDRTVEVARQYGARVIRSEAGRGLQLDTGARAAGGDILWFLHADTLPPARAAEVIRYACGKPAVVGGSFELIFSGASKGARLLTWIYPRLRRLGLSYGDSGVFVRRSDYLETGGFRHFALFEDLDFIRRLRRRGRFLHVDCALVTSSRRFEGGSFAWTFARWTLLQALYCAGVSPAFLAKHYRAVRQERATR